MATLLAISQFHSVAFMQLLQTLRHCYDSQVTEQLHNNSLFFIKCPKLLLTLQKCFKAFNLENDTARQRTPHGPAPGRGPVVADHCYRGLCGFVWFRHGPKCLLSFVIERLHASLTTRLSVKGVQARNQLGILGGWRIFWEGTKFFKLYPIVINYVQHTFPGGRKNYLPW